jgi:hypothetical protein
MYEFTVHQLQSICYLKTTWEGKVQKNGYNENRNKNTGCLLPLNSKEISW